MSTLMQLYRFYIPVQSFYQLHGVDVLVVLAGQPEIQTAEAYSNISAHQNVQYCYPSLQVLLATEIYKKV